MCLGAERMSSSSLEELDSDKLAESGLALFGKILPLRLLLILNVHLDGRLLLRLLLEDVLCLTLLLELFDFLGEC